MNVWDYLTYLIRIYIFFWIIYTQFKINFLIISYQINSNLETYDLYPIIKIILYVRVKVLD